MTNPSAPSQARVAITVVTGLLLVCALVFFGFRVWQAWDDERIPDEDRATAVVGDADERKDVLAATETFAEQMNTFSTADLEGKEVTGFRERVEPLLTDKFTTSFEDEAMVTVGALVDQTGATSEADILTSGIVELTEDSAITLVTGEVTLGVTKGPNKGASGLSLIRFQVDLLKIGGKWLVDGYTPVSEGGQR